MSGLVSAPLTLPGLYQFLEKRKTAGTLQSLQSEDGSVHCVFLCCDLPYQYMDEYFTKLEEDQFPEIHNKVGSYSWKPLHVLTML